MKESRTEINPIKRAIIRYPILPTFLFFIVMCVVFIIVSPHNRDGANIFLSPTNLSNIIEATATYSIGAFAMTLALLVGCIDLSCDYVIALGSVIMGHCMVTFGLGLLPSVLITLLVGAVCGSLNAFLINRCKVPPFLATISVGFIYMGLAYTLCKSTNIPIKSEAMIRVFGALGSGAKFLGMPVLLWWTLVFLIAFYLFISKSKFGRWAQAVGGNEQSAYASGVNVKLVRFVALVIMGVIAAFIGIVFCARLGMASPTYGASYSLKLIIAAILGGTSFHGEGGNVFGTLLGSLVMGVLTNGLSIINVNTYTQQIILGIVIVSAVVFSIYIGRKK